MRRPVHPNIGARSIKKYKVEILYVNIAVAENLHELSGPPGSNVHVDLVFYIENKRIQDPHIKTGPLFFQSPDVPFFFFSIQRLRYFFQSFGDIFFCSYYIFPV